jgi:pimeloyl-ACP methyl ester carboxylesterase
VTAAEGAPVPEDRVVVAGKVNFTIMYAAHDAFTRDLRRLRNACTTGRAITPHTAATWARFKTQLQIHHRAEDVTPTAVPGARVELLKGVGHTPMLEDPQTTGTLLLDFAAAAAHPS